MKKVLICLLVVALSCPVVFGLPTVYTPSMTMDDGGSGNSSGSQTSGGSSSGGSSTSGGSNTFTVTTNSYKGVSYRLVGSADSAPKIYKSEDDGSTWTLIK